MTGLSYPADLSDFSSIDSADNKSPGAAGHQCGRWLIEFFRSAECSGQRIDTPSSAL